MSYPQTATDYPPAYGDLCRRVCGLSIAGSLTQAGIDAVLKGAGINTWADLIRRPHLIPAVNYSLDIAVGYIRDSRGLPWDARIHAGTMGRRDNGTWRRKHNVCPELVKEIEAELRSRPVAPSVAVTVPPYVPPRPAPGQRPALWPPPVASPPLPMPGPGRKPAQTFHDLMMRITRDLSAKRLAQGGINWAVRQAAIPSLTSLILHPELIPQVDGYLDEITG